MDAKFESIMGIIAMELGFEDILSGLTAERRDIVQNLAEQSILNWASERRSRRVPRVPVTKLEHLLNEYCVLSDHI